MEAVIYGIVDPLTNQLRYIGQTTNFSKRKHAHFRKTVNKKDKNHLYNWMRRLQRLSINPEFFILDEVPASELDYWEIFYIDYFKSIGCELTNTCVGGSSRRGFTHTEEHKAKIANLMKGNSWNKGKKYSKERNAKIGAANLGKKRSEQSKLNMRKPQKSTKPVIQLDKEGNVIKIWDSIYTASRELGIHRNSIGNVVYGRAKTAGKFKWKEVN